MTIPFFSADFSRYSKAVADVVADNRAGPGKESAALADDLCAFTGAKYCVPTASGTVGLQVAAIALGLRDLGRLGRVLVPEYGAVQTANAFASARIDIGMGRVTRNGTLDVSELPEDIGLDALCHVDFCGRVDQSLLASRDYCRRRGIPLIEDAACALLSEWNGVKGGMTGDVGVFSFSGPKPITGGQGGAIVTNDEKIHQYARLYVNHGLRYDPDCRADQSHVKGTQGRMSDLSAALIRAQLADVGRIRERLAQIDALYRAQLDLYVTGSGAPYHNIIRSRDPNALIASLAGHGVEARRNYLPLQAHPAYFRDGRRPGNEALRWFNEAVYLPFGPGLTDEQVRQVCEAVLKSSTPHAPGTVH